MKITVKKKHLALATKARNSWNYSSYRDCLVAQAVKEKFPNREVSCRISTVFMGGHLYNIDKDGRNLIIDFVNEVPLELPVTIVLTLSEE